MRIDDLRSWHNWVFDLIIFKLFRYHFRRLCFSSEVFRRFELELLLFLFAAVFHLVGGGCRLAIELRHDLLFYVFFESRHRLPELRLLYWLVRGGLNLRHLSHQSEAFLVFLLLLLLWVSDFQTQLLGCFEELLFVFAGGGLERMLLFNGSRRYLLTPGLFFGFVFLISFFF